MRLAILAPILLVQAARAAFLLGYSDNRCTATISTFEGGLMHDQSGALGDNFHTIYSVACPDGVKYKSEYYMNSDNSSCVPFHFMESGKSSYVESSKSISFQLLDGTTKVCPDVFIPQVEADYTHISATKAPSFVTWSTFNETKASDDANLKYVPSEYTVSQPYPKTQPARARSLSGSTWIDLDKQIPALRWFAKIISAKDPKYFALVYCLPGMDNTDFYDKPMVVADAFDPFNARDAYTLESKLKYQNLFNSFGPRGKGYDLFFLDFSQGGGDIHINAGLELKFIQWMKQTTASKIMLGGPSMSGIVSRLALLYSMPENNYANGAGVLGQDLATNIKGYLTIDSPHQGASIGSSLQAKMYELKSNGVVTTADFFGNGNDPKDNWNQLNVPAAHQMLYEHYYANGTAVNVSHDEFYGFLNRLGGYRKSIPMVSIAYSNFYQPHPGFQAAPDLIYNVATIDPTLLSVRTVTSRNQDFAAGSAGDWYLSPFAQKSPNFVSTNGIGSPAEKFKGTFIPIRSAFDLNGNYPANGSIQDEFLVSTFSPFNAVRFMKNTYDGYCNTGNVCSQMDRNSDGRKTIEDKRYEHIVFDNQVMTAINDGLQTLENIENAKNVLVAAGNVLF
ncbi:MAG: hypothetical protein JWO30_1948 [Fibrobacteres bacterium]|nr:hypothetical protein [Fibrobacterota bacterium]